jgi:hypothetical protein
VNELKQKVDRIEENTTGLNRRIERVDSKFNRVMRNSNADDVREVSKPFSFPDTILFDNIPDLERFDKCLEDFDGDYAIYYVREFG